ncbi:outer membrane protein assembly factor BamA [Kordiimonas sp.]|uniref:outer membrane protein assembly factor BamA n=1 Tax=Kordiimonas sp. TaxID=1970157 RepID=UPI003A95028B
MSFSVPAMAQGQAAPQVQVIRQISVVGNERVEPETIASYLSVAPGEPFDPVKLDESLKTLFATGLFSDVELSEVQGALLVRVVENPIINRIVFEGNKRLDREELLEEVRLRPRMVFTRAKVRSDVQRMLELYRRSGRFAAIIEPKVVQLEQNRVDLLFEVQEGPKTKVSSIKFIGNEKFSDGDLRDVLATKQARWWKLFTSNDTFDPDRLAYDQQVLRQHYLNEGYADFRTVSAVSELTPDRKDFFITFSVDEGEIYEFGKIDVDSEIRDVNVNLFRAFLLMREGDIYNAEAIEKTIEALSNAAGLLGYAFVDVRPQINRDRETRKIDITFRVLDAPRVYVERINVSGNVRTLDRVIRREIRLQEGDAFNSALVTRSENRLNRLNFFREVDVEQIQGSEPDRMVLDVTVQEQATGELNLGAGFSSLENFIFDFSIRERNLMGKAQDLRLGLRLSGTRQEIDLGFTEPYFGGRNVAAGFDIFARKIDSSSYGSIFDTKSLGGSLRAGMAINEFWTLSTRYTLRQDDVQILPEGLDLYYSSFSSARYTANITDQDEIDRRVTFYDSNNDGVVDDLDYDTSGDGQLQEVEKFIALPRTIQDSIGTRWQSIVGYTVGFDTRNSIIRPTRGHNFYFSQDFAGLGGNVRYVRSTITTDNYWTPWEGWTFRLGGESGIIHGLGQDVRLSDKFFIGGPRIRGFDTSGMGPRDFANNYALGGTAYYIGRGELFFPLGDAALESGINASAFVDVGSLFRAQEGALDACTFSQAQYDAAEADSDFSGLDLNCMSGNSAAPRISVGIGFSWQSPFGPFRIDLSKQLKKQLGDRTQTLQFNVGTTF